MRWIYYTALIAFGLVVIQAGKVALQFPESSSPAFPIFLTILSVFVVVAALPLFAWSARELRRRING